MIFRETEISDVLIIETKVFQDERGFFLEAYQRDRFLDAGIKCDFVQDNHSGSKRGVLRGLHYQIQQPQSKLIQVLTGRIFDVCVDLRKYSPTFGKSVGITLSAEEHKQIWVPAGFAHGFYVLSDWAEISYKTSDLYAPQWERTLLWSDPDLNICWPIPEGEEPFMSLKDAAGKLFRDAEIYIDPFEKGND
jgi:dTDP-4-dehydrorhamnose 3,5-epimerase